jgi:hypothetical protein
LDGVPTVEKRRHPESTVSPAQEAKNQLSAQEAAQEGVWTERDLNSSSCGRLTGNPEVTLNWREQTIALREPVRRFSQFLPDARQNPKFTGLPRLTCRKSHLQNRRPEGRGMDQGPPFLVYAIFRVLVAYSRTAYPAF